MRFIYLFMNLSIHSRLNFKTLRAFSHLARSERLFSEPGASSPWGLFRLDTYGLSVTSDMIFVDTNNTLRSVHIFRDCLLSESVLTRVNDQAASVKF